MAYRWNVLFSAGSLGSQELRNPGAGTGLLVCGQGVAIGVLFRFLCSKIDGTGLDGSCSIYQGHLFVEKATCGRSFLFGGFGLRGGAAAVRAFGFGCLNHRSDGPGIRRFFTPEKVGFLGLACLLVPVSNPFAQGQGCGITRGFSNHFCDTFGNPP